MEPDLVKMLDDIKAQEPEAFNRFFKQVEGRVLSYGMKVCGQVEDAKDALQETLMLAFKSLPRLDFKDSKALNVWLYKVAKNSCLMMRRKGKYEPQFELSLEQFMPRKDGDSGSVEIPDWSNLPDDAALKNEVKEIIRHAMLSLPTQYRLVLVLRDMEQLSTKEVADILELSEQNVKIRLHRARLYLRESLERHFAGTKVSAITEI